MQSPQPVAQGRATSYNPVVLSTFWLTAEEHSDEVRRQLVEKGFDVVDTTRRARQPGVWLTVAHESDQTADVLAIITRVDPGAVCEF